MSRRQRAEAVATAVRRLGADPPGRDGRRLVVDRAPELIHSRSGAPVGVDVWVRLLDGDGADVPVDPHRRIINPPTVPRANVTYEERPAPGRSAEVERVRIVGEPDPAAAFWEAVWDSVTSYPNPGGRGTVTTVFADTSDGHVRSQDGTYSTARSGGSLVAIDSFERVFTGQAPLYTIYEGFLSFDTSSITDSDVVSDVDLDLWLVNDNSVDDFVLEARERDWGASLTTGDWVAGGSLGGLTLMASINSSGIGSTGAYKTFTSQTAFLTATNMKTGTVFLILNSAEHRIGNAPSSDEIMEFSQADEVGTTQDPKLTITHAPPNTAPTADAGPDQSVDEGTTVNLDGTGSTDPEDGQAGLGYEWTVQDADGTGLVDGDITGRLTDSPSFTAPEVSGPDANIVLQLEVTDSGGLTDTDTVTITVADTTLIEHTGAGGLVLGGAADTEFQRFMLLQHTGQGGFVLGGEHDLLFITPTFITPTGGLVLGGAAAVRAFNPTQVPSDIVVEWDFDNDGDFDEDVEDITSFVLALETLSGRDFPSQLTGKAGPGQLRATLDNSDDRFSFFNSASPLNSSGNSLRTGRKVRVRTTDATTNPDPALLARDRFRTDGALGDDEEGNTWSQPLADDFAVSGAEAVASGEGSEHIAVVDVGTADYYAQVQLAEVGAETTNLTGNVVGLVYRFQDTNDYSLAVLDVDAAQLHLIDVVSGTPSTVATEAVEPHDRMTIGVLVSGSTVSLYLEGVEVASGTAVQTDETQVGIYAEWSTGQPAPALDDFGVWDGLPAKVEGVLFTGDITTVNPQVQAGPRKLAQLDVRGVLSRPAGQDVSPPSTVEGRETGLLVGNTLAMVNLLHPPGPIDTGDITTGPFGMARAEAIKVLRRFEETELGFLFESNEGRVGFDSRTARNSAVSEVTFSDAPGSQFIYTKIEPRDWRREVFNRVFAGVAASAPSGVSTTTPTTTSTNVVVPMPATVNAGDLLLVIGTTDESSASAFDPPAGWVRVYADGADPIAVIAFAKVADGSEGGTSVEFAAGEDARFPAVVHRVTDWFGSLENGIAKSDVTSTNAPSAVFPPWGPQPSLFITSLHATFSGSASNPPIGYTDSVDTSVGAISPPFVQTASRLAATPVENPGEFGTATSVHAAAVIAVRGFNGDPPITSGVDTVQVDDTDSQDTHNAIRTHRLPSNLLPDETAAETYGELVLDRHADDRPIIAVEFIATKNAAHRAQAIRRRLSDRITLVAANNAGLGINQDFFIESISHRWSHGLTLWVTRWELSPVPET